MKWLPNIKAHKVLDLPHQLDAVFLFKVRSQEKSHDFLAFVCKTQLQNRLNMKKIDENAQKIDKKAKKR